MSKPSFDPADWHLQRATIADAAPISALVTAAYADYVDLLGRMPKPMLTDYDQVLAANLVYSLYEKSTQTLAAVLELVPFPQHLLIENIAVAPPYQHQGLGQFLLGVADSEARRLALPAIELYTNAKFTRNIAIYTRFGYQETQRRAWDDAAQTVVVYMKKPLP